MPRKVRDTNLETRTARSRLKVRHKPYFRLIEPGLHLGYRRVASGPGAWIVRHYSGKGCYVVENLRTTDRRLLVADDYSEPDGDVVLSFGQAQERAKAFRPGAAARGPYSVNNALDDYFEFLGSDDREGGPAPKHSVNDAKGRANGLIRPKLGDVKVVELDAKRLKTWRNNLAKAAPRLRTRKGEPQKHRTSSDTRARRASTNRVWTILRAALNHAFSNRNDITSDAAWRKVKPFKGVDKARVRYLEVAEAQRLANTTDPEFRPMVQAALLTGGRYGQLARLIISDFNGDAGTVRMTTRKGGGAEKAYHVHLTDEGVHFFKEACVGRNDANSLIFRTGDDTAWQMSDQLRPMMEASKRAKISPPVNFHCLRHTYASHAVMNGAPLMVVAKNLGHVDTRMVEKHYGHLAPSYVADAIRKGAPRFGFKPSKAVVTLR